jgi:hypothetical protein
MRNFQTKVAEKIKTHSLRSITFFFFEKEIVEKIADGEVTDDNMVHAHFTLDT